MSLLFKHLRIHQVFGANTDVGKTVFTTALVRASASQGNNAFYLKPVSTGAIDDADDVHVKRFAGKHAASINADCLFRYAKPVSPHLAARLEEGDSTAKVSDQALVDTIANHIRGYATDLEKEGHVYVETAGGVHSPTLSGSSQLDAYRPLFLPTILVGDSRLGGISSTISAFESLLLRGYIVDSVLLFKDDYYRNWEYLTSYFAEKDILVSSVVPPPQRHAEKHRDHIFTEDYYKDVVEAENGISHVVRHLSERHAQRLHELETMPSRTISHIWWPFVQHALVKPGHQPVTVIDSAHKDYFSVHNGGSSSHPPLADSLLDLQFDGSASWWTQCLGHSNPALTLAAARASGRYGHVMFPQATHLPALNLAETLLSQKGPGHGWANRVFFSDDGSTGMEIALKMALRAYSKRFGVEEKDKKNLGVLGLKGSYHGDTIGVMNACEAGEGVYTCEWHDAKGFWFDPPTLAIRNGRVIVSLPEAIADIVEAEGSVDLLKELGGDSGGRGEFGMSMAFAQVYDVGKRVHTKLAQVYRQYIDGVLDKLGKSKIKLAALVLEPLVMGAGGMIFVDPLFQRVMVDVVRSRDSPREPSQGTWRGLPVIFDEVFVGMYRLGHLSASSILGTHPDVSVHAKMLTGGLVPLAVTLAKEGIFEAFLGDSKDQALLHGHSYTAYPVGCEVANETFKETDKFVNGVEWEKAQSRWCKVNMKHVTGVEEKQARNIWSFWDPEFIDVLSRLKAVDDVMTLGTLLVVRVNGAGRGYRSDTAQQALEAIKASVPGVRDGQSLSPFGIHYRTLGDVAYLMTSLNTSAETIREVEKRILRALIVKQRQAFESRQ